MNENKCDSLAHEVAEELLKSSANRNRIVWAACIALVILAIGASTGAAVYAYLAFQKGEVKIDVSK